MKTPRIIKNWMVKWCTKNYPLMITTKIKKRFVIYVKKGKIREWRTYDEQHNRINDIEVKL